MTLSIIIILVLIVSIVLNVILFQKKSKTEKPRSVRTTILAGIQNVIELATVRQKFQSVVSFSDTKKFPYLDYSIPGTTKKFMLRYYGNIVCGCDLSQAQIPDKPENGKIKIFVPHSQIMDIYADVQSYEVFDQRAGIFTSIKLEDQNREVEADLNSVREREIQNGILARSDENARKILSSLATAAGIEAEIIFTENLNNALESNQPENQKVLGVES